MRDRNTISIIIMGVSGVGKTTIGKLLAAKTGIPFFDGDDFHSAENIAKMAAGHPLNDADRKDWLLRLNGLITKNNQLIGCIIACSALKQNYRNILSKSNETAIKYVFLNGTYHDILQRIQARKNHFMSASLLTSQFETLEVPENALTISITKSPEEIVAVIQKALF